MASVTLTNVTKRFDAFEAVKQQLLATRLHVFDATTTSRIPRP
jgi:hypothetical protein